MRTEKATQVRVKMGEETDQELLSYLERNPDKTIYELSKSLDWSSGKIQKALKRLENKLIVKEDIGAGRLRKRYKVQP